MSMEFMRATPLLLSQKEEKKKFNITSDLLYTCRYEPLEINKGIIGMRYKSFGRTKGI
jgi:hypothetical protein